MKAGTILYHKSFQFYNGEIGEKLLVLLNTPDLKLDEPFIVCRTTTNPKGKLEKYGCQPEQSVFFFPARSTWFNQDTWLQLYELYEFDPKSVLEDHFRGELQVKSRLDDLYVRQIRNCVKQIIDISSYHKKLILRKF